MTDHSGAAPPPVWAGLFDTWEQACQAAQARSEAFVSDRWRDRIVQQLQEYRDTQARHGLALPPRPCNLPWVCALTCARSIVDFGGSSGWCYDYLQHTLRSHEISSYVVVEIERIVEHMTTAGLHSAPVAYKTAGDSLQPCDLLYCNSALQYCESNRLLLDLIANVRPAHILLDDLIAKGDDDFFSTQHYYGTVIPYRFVGLQRLMSDLRGASYEPLLSAPFAAPVLGVIQPLPMGNFPEAFQRRYSLSVLLQRAATT